MDGRPWCDLCIAHLHTAARARWPLAVTLLVISGAAIVFGWRWQSRDGGQPMLGMWLVFGVFAVALAAWLSFRTPDEAARRTIVKRAVDEEPALDARARVGHPYRARLVRAAKLLAPPLSGRATAAVVGASLALPAIALPLSLGLPRWLELEIVLGSWWSIAAITLTVLLFRGFRLSDDYVLRAPSSPLAGKGSALGELGGCDPGCGMAAEGLAAVLIAFVAVAIAFLGAWLLVELIVPALFFLTYALVRSALARVANDEHGCEGSLVRALSWGLGWATVYVAPLALVVWAVHALTT